ncbi:MAG TPA: 4-deoxy-4-formamido-L-arabinose-phosphoundecaprenol deformylase [Lentisphaeria bacterium]|nr:MAG: hypothetical protein A2X47_06490 [Lentisphaerae bacterium GWF2_38_69]HBM15521.1 4-deoxy-4-formamido-L-arabinose-phosphoundecaprenol deformylase [Lentisphaeria bacterium]
MTTNEDTFFEKDELILGLKIDVDTYRGTKKGLPALIKLLNSEKIKGTFFLSIGKDNMGRNIWRIFKPKFLVKMLRNKAFKLYGFDILFRGFLWPGPDIGKILKKLLRLPTKFGQEIALHSYDHYKWQMNINKFSQEQVEKEFRKANIRWFKLFGSPPSAMGNPGWQLSEEWLRLSDSIICKDVKYRSDTRGTTCCRIKYNGLTFNKLQIPTTLPTYDEVIGRKGVTDETYNEYLLSLIEPGKLNVLTIQAEIEGIACFKMFREFVQKCKHKGIKIVPLSEIYEKFQNTGKVMNLHFQEIPGREGQLAVLKNS